MSPFVSTKETIFPIIIILIIATALFNIRSPQNTISLAGVQHVDVQTGQRQLYTTTTNNKVHILLSVDESEMLPMFVMINSIVENEKEGNRLRFHVLVKEDVSIYAKQLPKHLNGTHIEFKSVTNYPNCIKLYEYTLQFVSRRTLIKYTNNLMNFARFCIPHIFSDISDGIYVDVDMVAQESVSKLYDEYYYKHDYIAWSVINRKAKQDLRKMHREKYYHFVNNYLNHYLRFLSTIYS